MKRSRFSEYQIIRVLKEAESGRTVKDICREYGIAEATYYSWRAKYGGMEAADIKRLKELEDENRRLKQLYADMSLENRALKDIISKKCEADGEAGTGGFRQGKTWNEHPKSV